MENYPYQQARAVTGEASSSPQQQLKERRNKGGKRGAGVKLSTDPQSVAARQRRHRISDRFRILKSLVPGGSKMDTVSMLEEAIHYVKFLKTQIWLHQAVVANHVEESRPPLPPLTTHPSATDHHASAMVGGGGAFGGGSAYSPSSFAYSIRDQQMSCYSMPPPTPSLPPLPSFCFEREEDMFPYY